MATKTRRAATGAPGSARNRRKSGISSRPDGIQVKWHRPYLYPKQLAAIYSPARYSCIEASTKSGKTVGCMAWLFEQALKGKPGHQYWWAAKTIKQAKIAFRRYTMGLRRVKGFDSLDGPLFVANRSDLTLTLFNGCVLAFFSAEDPDNLYGEDVQAAVIDEASRCKESSWHAIRSTLVATQGPIRIIGNVKGRRNWFYRLCRKAESGTKNMHYSMITADDAVAAGVLPQSEIDDAREMLPEQIFKELFFAEAGDDEGNPFGLDSIQQCVIPELSTKKPRVWGWDLGKAQNYTVGIALDEDGNTCRFHRFQKPWEVTIKEIKKLTKTARAYVDSTGVGDPILEALRKGGGSNFRGFKFSASSKQQIMEGLAVVIQSNLIGYPAGHIVSELETFEYEYTRTGIKYMSMEGCHDDCVDALALANQGLKRRRPLKLLEGDDVIITDSDVQIEIIGAHPDDIPMLSDDDY